MAADREHNRNRRWLWLLLLAAIIAVIAFALRPQPLPVSTATVERRALTVTVQEQGRTRAREPYTIAAPVPGQLLRTPLREGDQVSAGQVVARIALAPEDQRTEAVLRANLDAAFARVTAARSALQEAALPFSGPDTVAGVAEPIVQLFAEGEYPHLMEMATEHVLKPGYDFGDEFEFGLNMILDALAAALPGNPC